MDASFFKPFVEGTLSTLKVQCAIEVRPNKPVLKSDSEKYAVASTIGINSPSFKGTVSLCFPKPVFLWVMSKMFGEPYTEITDDLADGAAELLNIIFGKAKVVLNENGHGLQMAIPTVVRGADLEIFHSAQKQAIVLPFETSEGIFALEIASE